MRVFLANLVMLEGRHFGYNCGLGYIAAVLKDAGHEVSYHILAGREDVRGFIEAAGREQPGVVGFSVTSSQAKHLESIVKELKTQTNAFVVCGGVHPTLDPDCIRIEGVDAVVLGEGEQPIRELADALDAGRDYLGIKNIWFKDAGEIVRNDVRPLIADLDELPFPDKTSLNYQKVIDDTEGINEFIFSRGCIFECTYCCNKAISQVYPNKHQYFRQRSPEKAIQEIERDAQRFDFNSIIFNDDAISLNRKWFFQFFDLYKSKFDYPFKCNLRVETVDDQIMRTLKEAGARCVMVGIEHGNEEFRRRVLNRNMTNKQITDTIQLADKYKINHEDFIMVGFPYENRELFQDTVRLCRQVHAKSRPSIFDPYPGTELGRLCREKGWLPYKGDYRERLEAVISYPGFSRQDIQECADVFQMLVRHKSIPLNTPYKLLNQAGKAYVRLKDAFPPHRHQEKTRKKTSK